MNQDVRSLQPYYAEGKNRNITYREMVDAILTEVKNGKKVVAAFYGHPGVFACVAHKAIKEAKDCGFSAHMEAGISAEDCLYADLGIDPGRTGCQHYETSQFMFYHRNIDTAAYLILWQVGLAGDTTLSKYSTSELYREVLVDLLMENYPKNHEIILYQAKVLPIDEGRCEILELSNLPKAKIFQHTTLVIPPCEKMKPNNKILKKLEKLNSRQEASNKSPKLTLIK